MFPNALSQPHRLVTCCTHLPPSGRKWAMCYITHLCSETAVATLLPWSQPLNWNWLIKRKWSRLGVWHRPYSGVRLFRKQQGVSQALGVLDHQISCGTDLLTEEPEKQVKSGFHHQFPSCCKWWLKVMTHTKKKSMTAKIKRLISMNLKLRRKCS